MNNIRKLKKITHFLGVKIYTEILGLWYQKQVS